jgi:hypothetical protein
MLSEEVVDAVKAGRFRIFAVSTIEEGIEILTGTPAGQWQDGTYPKDTVFGRVAARLDRIREALERKPSEDEEEPSAEKTKDKDNDNNGNGQAPQQEAPATDS